MTDAIAKRRKLVGAIWAAVGVVATVVGLVTAWPPLRQMLSSNPTHVKVVLRGRSLILGSDTRWPDSGVFVAQKISISGEVSAPPLAALVANEIDFRGNARLRGRQLAIVAAVMTGPGVIDVSGNDGAQAGADGQPGGVVEIAAATVNGLSVFARGGRGADGLQGAIGPAGQNGRCAGFGGWRPARQGEPGRRGGDGGAAGPGGQVVLLIDPQTVDRVSVNIRTGAGEPGEPGPGGPGGQGGAGCVGLGGSQTGRGQGPTGPSGSRGKEALAGTQSEVPIRFGAVVRTLRTGRGSSTRAAWDAKYVLDVLKELSVSR